MFEGFQTKRIKTSGAEIHLVQGGEGPPLLLLHGYPQTHALWHKVAPGLARQFTVVAPDLRGYGDSAKPSGGGDHALYAKRSMAQDQVEMMAALGFERFHLAGHDRGARVAYRLALDHSGRVRKLAVLDIVPTIDYWESLDRAKGVATYHWYFLAQPYDLPERLIGADPDFFLDWTLASWRGPSDAFTAEALAEYRRCFRDPRTIHASCEDYRAGATVDCDIDLADRRRNGKIACPLLCLWGDLKGFGAGEPLAVWRRWADDVAGRPLACGHFLPEEAPAETEAELKRFFATG